MGIYAYSDWFVKALFSWDVERNHFFNGIESYCGQAGCIFSLSLLLRYMKSLWYMGVETNPNHVQSSIMIDFLFHVLFLIFMKFSLYERILVIRSRIFIATKQSNWDQLSCICLLSIWSLKILGYLIYIHIYLILSLIYFKFKNWNC